MKILYVAVFLFGVLKVDGALQKVGCFNTTKSVSLPLYKNFRDFINWKCTWPNLGYILNGCAVEAGKNGFTWFAVEFWGLCRGGVGDVNNVLSSFPQENDCHQQVGPAHRMVVYECDPVSGCSNPGYYDGQMPQEIFKYTRIDECKEGTDDCDGEHGLCSDVCFGFKCECKPGYDLEDDGKTCKDIDECSTGQHNCDAGTEECVNTDGSFRCKCKSGFLLEPNTKKCQFICDEKLDLGLIVDSSSSIEDVDFELLREFLRRFTNAFIISQDKTQTGLIRFSDAKEDHTKVIFDFLKYHNNAKVATAVSTFDRVSGQTLGDYALHLAGKHLFVPAAGRRQDDLKVTSVAVVITDGKFKYSPKKYADILKSNRVHIIAVAISDEIDTAQLLKIVTDENKDFFHIQDFQQLVQRVFEIARRVCEV